MASSIGRRPQTAGFGRSQIPSEPISVKPLTSAPKVLAMPVTYEGQRRETPSHALAVAARLGERVAADPAKLLGEDVMLDEADRAVLARHDIAALTRETTTAL